MKSSGQKQAYRTFQLMKWARYDLIIEISDYNHNITKLCSRRKSELIGFLIDLERRLEE